MAHVCGIVVFFCFFFSSVSCCFRCGSLVFLGFSSFLECFVGLLVLLFGWSISVRTMVFLFFLVFSNVSPCVWCDVMSFSGFVGLSLV